MELLVRIEDKPGLGPIRDTRLSKRGDVIAVAQDGHDWTVPERTHTFWRILAVPDLSEAEAQALTTPPLPPDGREFVFPLRGFRLDLDALPGDRTQFDPAEPRKDHLTFTRDEIDAVKQPVSPIERTQPLKDAHTDAVVSFQADRAGKDRTEFRVADLAIVFDLGGDDVDLDYLSAHTGRPLAEVIEAKTQSDARAEAVAEARR